MGTHAVCRIGFPHWFLASQLRFATQVVLVDGLKGYLKNRNMCGVFGNRVRGGATHPTQATLAERVNFQRVGCYSLSSEETTFNTPWLTTIAEHNTPIKYDGYSEENMCIKHIKNAIIKQTTNSIIV